MTHAFIGAYASNYVIKWVKKNRSYARMQIMGGGGIPLLPGVDVLPKSAVARTRHVGEHAVELK